MSEYQYYEFQAVDRPLTEKEMAVLGGCSSRATITPTHFVNEYHWGDLKADPSLWMETYFDAYVHLANWGTREMMFRLPRRVLPLEVAREYLPDEWRLAYRKGEHLLLGFVVDDEAEDWSNLDLGSGCLASLLPLRADIASGDHRALYIGWLRSVQDTDPEDLAGNLMEPPLPGGLRELTGPLRALIDFLDVDEDLVAVAAVESPRLGDDSGVARWIEAMPEAEKTEFLRRIAAGEEQLPRAELLRRYRAAHDDVRGRPESRSVTDLLAAATVRRAERSRREAERAAKERAHREREAAVARGRYLDRLAEREVAAWNDVEALVATKRPKNYDAAVTLLSDLRDLAARESQSTAFSTRLRRLEEQHVRKVSFVRRLRDTGLSRPATPLLDSTPLVESTPRHRV